MRSGLKKHIGPLGFWLIFETIAVVLWLTKGNIFYLFNFSYIGTAIALGLFLFQRKYKHARRIVQLLVGLYMLVYLRPADFWKRLVRLCLLDRYGAGFSPV